ncbi:hypothetical protein CRG98_015559 [Punica granatum]|uniref:Uncharacterized protein n=1 Tax=Punica granatum TaxID=22663 RepID=A0A2I0K672_PUNGR|nr:hypothetical protein CRG98_015559 [Punica granatum]
MGTNEFRERRDHPIQGSSRVPPLGPSRGLPWFNHVVVVSPTETLVASHHGTAAAVEEEMAGQGGSSHDTVRVRTPSTPKGLFLMFVTSLGRARA